MHLLVAAARQPAQRAVAEGVAARLPQPPPSADGGAGAATEFPVHDMVSSGYPCRGTVPDPPENGPVAWLAFGAGYREERKERSEAKRCRGPTLEGIAPHPDRGIISWVPQQHVTSLGSTAPPSGAAHGGVRTSGQETVEVAVNRRWARGEAHRLPCRRRR